MNYQKIYDDLISKARYECRKKLNKQDINYVYYENHHIIPKCLGGNDEKNNLVLLTAKEHFIAHKLLVFIHSHNKNIVYACVRLAYSKSSDYIKSARDYEFIKHFLIKIPMSLETRNKIGKAQRGKIRSDEFKRKNREAHLGTNTGEKNNLKKYIKENRKGKTLKDEMTRIYGIDDGLYRYNNWIKKTSISHSKPILQIDKNDNVIKEWPSIKSANECGFTGANICSCIKGKRKTHKGYKWRYK